MTPRSHTNSVWPADGSDVEVKRLQAAGLSLLEMGAGDRVVVMLHGIGGTADSCRAAGAVLAAEAGCRVLCLDAPGYGDSADPVGEVDHVAAVVSVLDALGVGSVDLFGTSWGGVIATLVAVRHPGRVRTLVLADSTRGSALTADKAAAMRGRVAELESAGAAAFAAARAPRLVSPQSHASVRDEVERTMATMRVPGYRAAAEFMATTDTGGVLADISRPTLVLVGEDDIVTGVEESALLARTIPGARFVIIEHAGHAAVTERPEAVARAIRTFWEER